MTGGSVRDCLLDKTPNDIDLVCSDSGIGSAEQTAKLLASANNASFVPFLKKIDDPCFRVVSKDPELGYIDISPIRCNNIISDMNLRDFTINSMAIKINSDGTMGDLIDPLNGAGDLEKGIIRISGTNALLSDPLRILRAFRFAAKLRFKIDLSTIELIKANAEKLKKISSERIIYELIEIFKNDNAAPFIRLMDQMKILEIIFPDIIPMKKCSQNGFHHLNVWDHSLLVLENCEHIINHLEDYFDKEYARIQEILNNNNCIPLLKIGSMLHDIGKPKTKSICKNTGRITFYKHQKIGGLMVNDIARGLRMPKKEQNFLNTLITEHMQVFALSDPDVKTTTKMRWFRKIGDNVIPVIIQGMADIMSTLGLESSEECRKSFFKWALETINSYFKTIKPKLHEQNLITGKELISLGMIPGPDMGKILTQIREAQDSGIINNHQEAIKFLNNLFHT